MQTANEIKEWFKSHYGFLPTEKQVTWELRVQQLEDEGLTRSDAQGVADVEQEQKG